MRRVFKAWGSLRNLRGGLVAAAVFVVPQSALAAAEVTLPSGLVGYLQEVITQPGTSAPTYRYRYVAPDFSRPGDLTTVVVDLEYLCAEKALPDLPEDASDGTRIIVSLADQPTEFGVATPEATQVFEAFRVENGRCMWEEF